MNLKLGYLGLMIGLSLITIWGFSTNAWASCTSEEINDCNKSLAWLEQNYDRALKARSRPRTRDNDEYMCNITFDYLDKVADPDLSDGAFDCDWVCNINVMSAQERLLDLLLDIRNTRCGIK